MCVCGVGVKRSMWVSSSLDNVHTTNPCRVFTNRFLGSQKIQNARSGCKFLNSWEYYIIIRYIIYHMISYDKWKYHIMPRTLCLTHYLSWLPLRLPNSRVLIGLAQCLESSKYVEVMQINWNNTGRHSQESGAIISTNKRYPIIPTKEERKDIGHMGSFELFARKSTCFLKQLVSNTKSYRLSPDNQENQEKHVCHHPTFRGCS